MIRIEGKYTPMMESTRSLEIIDGIDYRQAPGEPAPVETARVYAVDHEYGIVIRTAFYDISYFQPIKVPCYPHMEPSDYHEKIQEVIEHYIESDKTAQDTTNTHSERNHP